MRKHAVVFLAILLAFAGGIVLQTPPLVQAQQQQATPTQAVAQHLDAATICGSSATTAGTITFTVPSNQAFYMTWYEIENSVGASAVTAAAQTTITSSGFAGTLTFTVPSGTTAGSSTSLEAAQTLIKGTVGTNVVFTLPAFATNQTIRMNVCGYFGA